MNTDATVLALREALGYVSKMACVVTIPPESKSYFVCRLCSSHGQDRSTIDHFDWCPTLRVEAALDSTREAADALVVRRQRRDADLLSLREALEAIWRATAHVDGSYTYIADDQLDYAKWEAGARAILADTAEAADAAELRLVQRGAQMAEEEDVRLRGMYPFKLGPDMGKKWAKASEAQWKFHQAVKAGQWPEKLEEK